MRKKTKHMKKYEKKIKINKIIILFIFTLILISFVTVLARYVSNNNSVFFNKSKEFYFQSDKLTEKEAIYKIDNWSGVDDYLITINMNTKGNNLVFTQYDVSYDVSYTCSDNAICNLTKTNGIIYSSTNTDYFNLRITPNTKLNTGDMISVQITAHANSPYEKTLKATFNLVVGQEKISYEILDYPNRQYLELNITNTLSFFIVNESFLTYNVNDKITREVYLSLSEADRKKCYSALITLKFNPNILLLDMTNNNYLNAKTITKILKNQYDYIDGVTFGLDAITSTKVRFYKIDPTQNYTFPNGNSSSIIDVKSI